ncbi:MAG: glycosyltransferase [Planctomycetota bacterium]
MDPAQTQTIRQDARSRLELTESEKLLVVPGRMVRGGGHRTALWARGMLCLIDPDIHIALPVGGPMLTHVRHFARHSSIDGRGLLPESCLPLEDMLQAADVAVIIPSVSIAVSIPTLLDAGRAGLPIVAADLPEVRRLYADGRDALLVEPGSARAAAAAILRILDDTDLADKLGRNARQTALDREANACPPTC